MSNGVVKSSYKGKASSELLVDMDVDNECKKIWKCVRGFWCIDGEHPGDTRLSYLGEAEIEEV